MDKAQRDQLISLIDAMSVELRICKITIPNIRDTSHGAKAAAFTEAVRRIWTCAGALATAAGLHGLDAQCTLDLDAHTLRSTQNGEA